MSKFEVGQKVVLISRYREPREFPVAKVGRKYVHVGGGVFDMETGYEQGDRYGNGTKVATVEAWAETEKRRELIGSLRLAGLDIRTGTRFSTAKLERLLIAAQSED